MPPSPEQTLPLLNERSAMIEASADDVFRALGVVLPQTFARAALGFRVLGATPTTSSGDPLTVGSTMPGFATVRSVPPTELELAGGHRLSRYALVVRLEEDGPRTTVRLQTRGVFPGNAGRLYRTLAITSGADALGLRTMLRAISKESRRR